MAKEIRVLELFAGLGKGGDEGSGTRSSLMYETLRIIEKLKPKYVIWENVKNLLSKKHRHNFDAYLENMKQLGYVSSFKVLNAKDYGVPQNRERVFTVSVYLPNLVKDFSQDLWSLGLFGFPEPIPLEKKLKDILEDKVDEKYFLSEKTLASFTKENTGNYPRKERFLQNINKLDKTIANTITTRAGQRPTDNFVYQDGKLRKLTPKEIWRLMGFDENDVKKCSEIVSETQLYKQAGNSIVVNVLMAILKELLGEEYGAKAIQ